MTFKLRKFSKKGSFAHTGDLGMRRNIERQLKSRRVTVSCTQPIKGKDLKDYYNSFSRSLLPEALELNNPQTFS